MVLIAAFAFVARGGLGLFFVEAVSAWPLHRFALIGDAEIAHLLGVHPNIFFPTP